MTLHLTKPQVTVHYVHRDVTVVGTAQELDNIITNHRAKGTFIRVTDAVPLADGRTQITLWLRQPLPTRPTARATFVGEHARTRRPRHGTRIAVIVTAVTGTIAGLVAVAAYLLGQLVELIAEHAGLILGVLALAVILAALAARGSGRRRHCPGC